MNPIVLTYALPDEVRSFLRKLKIGKTLNARPWLRTAEWQNTSLLLCHTGVGIANAHEAAETIFQYARPSLILSIGCAGATTPSLKTGDFVFPAHVLSETPTDLFTMDVSSRKKMERFAQHLEVPFDSGSLMTLWKIAGKREKEAARARQAVAVDMETAALAAIAEKEKTPFLSVRVIFDTSEEELPFDEPPPEKNGERVGWILKNPKVLLQIPDFARKHTVCQKNLERILSLFLTESSKLPKG